MVSVPAEPSTVSMALMDSAPPLPRICTVSDVLEVPTTVDTVPEMTMPFMLT